MAGIDRFPLIIDADNSNIKELPEGDNLNLANSNINNLVNLNATGIVSASSAVISGSVTADTLSITNNGTVSGSLTVSTDLNVTGDSVLNSDVNVSGTVDANNYTVNGGPLSTLQVQSDWNESDNTSAAFIQNKPSINTINSLNDIPDVFVSTASAGEVLTYDGVSWQSQTPQGGVTLSDFSVIIDPTPSGDGFLSYNTGNGEFTFTQAEIPRTTSALTNDAGFLIEEDVLPIVSADGFIKLDDLSSVAPIAYDNVTGIISFDNTTTNFTTLNAVQSSLTLDDVTSVDNTTANDINVGAVNSSSGTSSFNDISTTSIDVVSNYTSTNGSITTINGDIEATNGSVTATNVNGDTVTASTLISTPSIATASGDITFSLPTNGDRVSISQGFFALSGIVDEASAQNGDMRYTPSGQLELYSDDIGGGIGGWQHIGGTPFNASRGIALPVFDTAGRDAIPNPQLGELILNTDTATVQLYNGVGWSSL